MKTASLRAVALLAAVPLALAACSSGTADSPSGGASAGAAGGGSGEPVLLGSSLSMTGPLGQFGVALKAGYEQLVSDVNAAGGLDVGGTKRQVQLKVLDIVRFAPRGLWPLLVTGLRRLPRIRRPGAVPRPGTR